MRLSNSAILLLSLHCFLGTSGEAKDLQDDLNRFQDQEGDPDAKIIGATLKTVEPEAETEIGTEQTELTFKIMPLSSSRGTGWGQDWGWWNRLSSNYSSIQYPEISRFQKVDYEKMFKDVEEAIRRNEEFKNMPKFEVPKYDWPKLNASYTTYKGSSSYKYPYRRSRSYPYWLIIGVLTFKIIIIAIICLQRRCGICKADNARIPNGNVYGRLAEPADGSSMHTVIIVSGPNEASQTASESVPKPEDDSPPSYETVVKAEESGHPSYDQNYNSSANPKEPSA